MVLGGIWRIHGSGGTWRNSMVLVGNFPSWTFPFFFPLGLRPTGNGTRNGSFFGLEDTKFKRALGFNSPGGIPHV